MTDVKKINDTLLIALTLESHLSPPFSLACSIFSTLEIAMLRQPSRKNRINKFPLSAVEIFSDLSLMRRDLDLQGRRQSKRAGRVRKMTNEMKSEPMFMMIEVDS